MKKPMSVLFMAFLIVIAFSNCKKDDVDVAYSKNTIEENKLKIEEEGLAMFEKLDGMKNLAGMNAVMDFENLAYTDPVAYSARFKPVIELIDPITKLGKDKLAIVKLRVSSEEVDAFFTLFGNEAGIYNWNSLTNDFDWTSSPDEMTFKYPSEGSTTNNITLSVTNLAVSDATQQTEQPMVTSMNIILKNSGTTLFSLEMTGRYDEDGLPTNLTTEFEFKEGYTFSQKFTNNGTDAKWDVEYAFKGDNIFKAHLESAGEFIYDNIVEEDIENPEYAEKFLDDADAYIQFGNIRLSAVVNYEKLNTSLDEAFPQGIGYTEEDNVKASDIYNENVKMCVLFAKERKAIAKSLFYAYEYSPVDYPGEFTSNVKFVFSDGSSMDASFFETGFDELIAAYDDFILEMQENYNTQILY